VGEIRNKTISKERNKVRRMTTIKYSGRYIKYRYASLDDGNTFWEMLLRHFVVVRTCTYTNLV